MPKQAEKPETQVLPEPGLEKRIRRRLTTEYKLRMLANADVCPLWLSRWPKRPT
jgi:hypothetical protein